MSHATKILASVGLLATLGSSYAVDVDINLGTPTPPRTVVVQQPPVVERRWVPEHVVRKEEQVIVEPARIEKRAEQVLVEPAHLVKREERVLIAPAHVERRKEQVLVAPARIEKQWVPGEERDSIRIGPLEISEDHRAGHWREVEIPAQYNVVVREVTVPERYETFVKSFTVPPRYETVYKEYQVPPRYEVRARDVVIPGHYEEVTVQPPPTVVEERGRGGLNIDLEFGKKHHDHDRDREQP